MKVYGPFACSGYDEERLAPFNKAINVYGRGPGATALALMRKRWLLKRSPGTLEFAVHNSDRFSYAFR